MGGSDTTRGCGSRERLLTAFEQVNANFSLLFTHLFGGGEANLVMPDLSQVSFLGVNGHTLLMVGLVVCALGLLFGLVIYTQLKNMPVHKSMLDVSELIYATCKSYMIQQGKFLFYRQKI